jgi:hypothetical protein
MFIFNPYTVSSYSDVQGISIGAGIIPNTEKLMNNIKSHTNIANNLNMSNNTSMSSSNPNVSGVEGRYWPYTNGADSILDDDIAPLEAGKPDLSSYIINYTNPTLSQYSNNGNNSYDVTTRTHPTDPLGNIIKTLIDSATQKILQSNDSNGNNGYGVIVPQPTKIQDKQNKGKFPKEINMKVTVDHTCDDLSYPYPKTSNDFEGKYCTSKDIDLNKYTNKNDFCYIDSNIPPDLVKYYATNNIKKCSSNNNKYHDKLNEDTKKYQEDLNIDKNQLMFDNKKSIININMSCNQAKNTDEYGYSGYGTPTLYNQCSNKGSDNQCSNNKGSANEGNYYNTLQGWYGDMSSGNNVFRRKNQWKDRDYYKEGYEQSNMSTLTNRELRNSSNNNGVNSNSTKNNTKNNTNNTPYTQYTPYQRVYVKNTDNVN